MMRAPDAPIGWPSATAPPLTLTFSSSMPSIRIELSVTDANASLISHRSTSSALMPSLSSSVFAAVAGVRGEVGEVVGGLRLADDLGEDLLAVRPAPTRRWRATSAPAPSLTPGELPAVCEPSLPTRPGSLASASSDESRRGASSTSTTVSPLRPLTVTETISSARRPSSVAAIARSCERSAQRSRSGRVISSSSPTSVASTNICLPLNGLVRPSWTIASSAFASPMR